MDIFPLQRNRMDYARLDRLKPNVDACQGVPDTELSASSNRHLYSSDRTAATAWWQKKVLIDTSSTSPDEHTSAKTTAQLI